MKNLILTLCLMKAFSSSAQVGVITIAQNDLMPYDQWYRYKEKKFEDKIFYLNEDSLVELVLADLLAEWEVTIDDGKLDEFGSLYWLLDNENGYNADVYLMRRKEEDAGNSIIMILVYEKEDD